MKKYHFKEKKKKACVLCIITAQHFRYGEPEREGIGRGGGGGVIEIEREEEDDV